MIDFNTLISMPRTLVLVELAPLPWWFGLQSHGSIRDAGLCFEGFGVILIG